MTTVEFVSDNELFNLVEQRRAQVRMFLDWAERREDRGQSMYLANRVDILDAREAAALYPNAWWGVVVFTCFGSLNSARALRQHFREPVDIESAKLLLNSVAFSSPKVGHHRIQPGLRGAKIALVAACERSDLIQEVLFTEQSFDDRFQRLRGAHLPQWGRTTSFDLLLRTGALSIGNQHYEPEIAYLDGSTGPMRGFEIIWGCTVNDQTASRCEGVLQAWHRNWTSVAGRVGVHWTDRPYAPGDLENALCIYQERAN